MSFKQIRAAYLERDGNLSGANIEDMIARRVLAGMGFKQTQVYAMECAVFGEAHPDSTLLQRVERLFVIALGRYSTMTRDHADHWTIIAQETDSAHKQALERFTLFKELTVCPPRLPLVFARIKGTDVCLAFVPWDEQELRWLKPPYKVVDSLDVGLFHGRLVVQELSAFVKGLADYRSVIRLEEHE